MRIRTVGLFDRSAFVRLGFRLLHRRLRLVRTQARATREANLIPWIVWSWKRLHDQPGDDRLRVPRRGSNGRVLFHLATVSCFHCCRRRHGCGTRRQVGQQARRPDAPLQPVCHSAMTPRQRSQPTRIRRFETRNRSVIHWQDLQRRGKAYRHVLPTVRSAYAAGRAVRVCGAPCAIDRVEDSERLLLGDALGGGDHAAWQQG